jgi:competence protein ComEC
MHPTRLVRSLFFAIACAAACAAQDLRVYAIDVEGGKATLYVAPSGHSLLLDTGYDGFANRDAQRIAAAARDAGISAIDSLLVTHYHADHAGGVAQLAALLPIRHIYDHGRNHETQKDVHTMMAKYSAIRRKAPHTVLHPGGRIPVPGLDVRVVTAAGKAIRKPLTGAGQPNAACAAYRSIAPDPGENSSSIGVVIEFGKFRLVDLGDLYWNREAALACPDNLLGHADVYMTTHHAKKTSGAPAIVDMFGFKAAIMNNGPKTGADPDAWQTIHDAPGRPDIWQLHAALLSDAAHNSSADFIANPEEKCAGDWIRLTAHSDGSFTIRNGRTGFEKQYR